MKIQRHEIWTGRVRNQTFRDLEERFLMAEYELKRKRSWTRAVILGVMLVYTLSRGDVSLLMQHYGHLPALQGKATTNIQTTVVKPNVVAPVTQTTAEQKALSLANMQKFASLF